MRKFFSLFAAVLFAGSMMATDVTLTMSNYAATSFEAEGISVSTAKNTSSTTPAYNSNYKDLRVYAKGSITLEANTNITSISFVISSQGKKRLAPLTANTGSVEVKGTPDFTAVWTGSATSVTLTVGDKADYGTEGNTKAGQLCFTAIEVTLEGGTPTPKYYLVGSLIGWKPNADYKLKENSGQEGEYMIDAVLAANEGIKVIGVLGTDTTWYKDGVGNEYIIRETGKYTVYFRPGGNQQWGYTYFEPVKANCPLYNVAEAIAAEPSKNDEMFIRGVVTKIEIKGANFKTYGSANIYVKDATGATGEFEFYNSYSIKGATYTTTSPAYDASSTVVKEFDAVSDGTYTVTVGDTVVAYGKYDYYSSTHELQQNCYIVEIIEGEKPEPETIDVHISGDGVLYLDYIQSDKYWMFEAANDELFIMLSNLECDQAAGTYPFEDLDPDYCYILTATDSIWFTAGSLTVTESQNGDMSVAGQLTGKDRNIYDIQLTYEAPKPLYEETLTITSATIVCEEGVLAIYGTTADGVYVQIAVTSDVATGTFTITKEDYNGGYCFVTLDEDEEEYAYMYSGTFVVTSNPFGYLVNATILCDDNTVYYLTFTESATGIEGVNANAKAVKTIKDGQLLIEKAGVRYNAAGAIVK